MYCIVSIILYIIHTWSTVDVFFCIAKKHDARPKHDANDADYNLRPRTQHQILKKKNNTKAQTNEAKSVSHEYDQKHEPPKKRLSVDLGIYYIYTVSIQL